jgi:hypothetical protein
MHYQNLHHNIHNLNVFFSFDLIHRHPMGDLWFAVQGVDQIEGVEDKGIC